MSRRPILFGLPLIAQSIVWQTWSYPCVGDIRKRPPPPVHRLSCKVSSTNTIVGVRFKGIPLPRPTLFQTVFNALDISPPAPKELRCSQRTRAHLIRGMSRPCRVHLSGVGVVGHSHPALGPALYAHLYHEGRQLFPVHRSIVIHVHLRVKYVCVARCLCRSKAILEEEYLCLEHMFRELLGSYSHKVRPTGVEKIQLRSAEDQNASGTMISNLAVALRGAYMLLYLY